MLPVTEGGEAVETQVEVAGLSLPGRQTGFRV